MNTCRPNITSVFAPAAVNVTLHNVQNVYVCSPGRLWLAYGITIFFAGVVSMIGLWALLDTGVSYSSDFSSVFRIGRGASIDVKADQEDMNGKDPLPKYLASAHIWFGEAKGTIEKARDAGNEADMSPNTQERVTGNLGRDS